MTTTTPTPEAATTARTGTHWIDDWRPEDDEFWESTGRRVARRNLGWSIFAEHLGFSVWLIWSVSSAFLVAQGFTFTPQQLFFLVAIPNLVGSLLRLPYTFAVPRFGGRNWTIISAGLLLLPTLLFAYVVTQPGTPYWVFCVVAATAGFGAATSRARWPTSTSSTPPPRRVPPSASTPRAATSASHWSSCCCR